MSSSVVGLLWKKYQETPSKLKIVDLYLFYIMLTGAIQFLYCLLVGTFPFNSFLSGFISCVASFVLTGTSCSATHLSLRIFDAFVLAPLSL